MNSILLLHPATNFENFDYSVADYRRGLAAASLAQPFDPATDSVTRPYQQDSARTFFFGCVVENCLHGCLILVRPLSASRFANIARGGLLFNRLAARAPGVGRWVSRRWTFDVGSPFEREGRGRWSPCFPSQRHFSRAMGGGLSYGRRSPSSDTE